MANLSTTDLVYEPCEKFGQYVGLLLEFAGDRGLLDEIIRHRMNCETCETNYQNYLKWSKGKNETERSRKNNETSDRPIGALL